MNHHGCKKMGSFLDLTFILPKHQIQLLPALGVGLVPSVIRYRGGTPRADVANRSRGVIALGFFLCSVFAGRCLTGRQAVSRVGSDIHQRHGGCFQSFFHPRGTAVEEAVQPRLGMKEASMAMMS